MMSSSNECGTVFIVDDDASVLKGISRIVRLAGYEAVTHTSAEEFLHQAKPSSPSPCCLVVDLTMPGMGGLDLQQRLIDTGTNCPVIFMSGNGSIPATVQAMKRGAVTFLSKPFDHDDLLQAISEALGKQMSVENQSRRVIEIRQRIRNLTDREKEVMGWVISGMLNKQIAARMGIVEKTVKVHRARVMGKMQTQSVAELTRLCADAEFPPNR
ncbi:MAG: response regulator [Akkermansiaceae bacterium]|nr:response regulator [Akkermansiaceae bacterium]